MNIENITTSYYCNSCNKNTNHTICKEIHEKSNESNSSTLCFGIIKCKGCDEHSFVKIEIDHDDVRAYEIDGEEELHPQIHIHQYPEPFNQHSGIDFHEQLELPDEVYSIYQDTLRSYHGGSKILVGVGCRACIEAVCNELSISGKDLQQKIENLKQKGYISDSNITLLNGVRFMGNDAVHDMKQSTHDQIKVALRVVEQLFEKVYILPKIAEGQLHGTIDDYDRFKQILSENLGNFNSGDEFGLYKLLGENYRRCQDNITSFQSHLIQDINGGNFSSLKIGQVKTHNNQAVQCFIVV